MMHGSIALDIDPTRLVSSIGNGINRQSLAASESRPGLERPEMMLSEGYCLIVDDDPDALEILSRIVRTLGLAAQTARDGLEAMEVLRESDDGLPAIVLLDLMMPGMDGYTVLSRLLGSPATRDIPVIVVTACSMNQIDMLRLPGVSEVVRKGTFTVESFRALVSRVLGIAS